MTLDEILAANHQKYGEMRMKFMNNEITTEEWLSYCDMFLNMILTSDDIVAMFERMKNDQTTN